MVEVPVISVEFQLGSSNQLPFLFKVSLRFLREMHFKIKLPRLDRMNARKGALD